MHLLENQKRVIQMERRAWVLISSVNPEMVSDKYSRSLLDEAATLVICADFFRKGPPR